MYLVINKCVIAVKVSNFSGHYLRNRSNLDISVLGYICIVQHKEHSPEVLSIPPGTLCIVHPLVKIEKTLILVSCWLAMSRQSSVSYRVYVQGADKSVARRGREQATATDDFDFHILIYLLTAIGLSPGGSSTVHIYTQTIHRTIQNKQYIEQHNNFGRVRAVPRLG